MANLTDSTNLTGTITLSKATGTKVTLDTVSKYLTKDIELIINAPTTSATAQGATVSYGEGWISAGSTTVTDSNLIADNIKDGVTIFGVTGSFVGSGGGTILVSDTVDAGGGIIREITTTEDPIYLETLNATSNGSYVPTTNHFYNAVNVNVTGTSGSISLQEKTGIVPTETSQTITPDIGYGGLSSVQVNAISSTYVGSGITSRNSSSLTASGATVTAPAGYYADAATKTVTDSNLIAGNIKSGVSIFGVTGNYTGSAPSLQAKTNITPTTSSQTIEPDSGYDGLSSVQINAMPTGSATAPASISGTSASISTGTGTITLTKTVSVTPSVTAGYVGSGTAGNSTISLTAPATINPTPTASGATVTIPAGYYTTSTTKSVSNGSASGPSTVSGTSATVSTGTNTLTLTKTVLVAPTVTAGYVSSGIATNASVSLTASVTTKAAATITPTTTSQTIASGTYLTGTQTISGDANLVGSNILSGKSIFGVVGAVTFSTVHTGTTTPSSSIGNNGDIYIDTSNDTTLSVGTLDVTSNGTYNAPSGTVYDTVNVAVTDTGNTLIPIYLTITGHIINPTAVSYYYLANSSITYPTVRILSSSLSRTQVWLPTLSNGKGLLIGTAGEPPSGSIYAQLSSGSSGATIIHSSSPWELLCDANAEVIIDLEID